MKVVEHSVVLSKPYTIPNNTCEERPLTEDWSFAELKRVETLWGPHGYHRYPAKFIPQLVRRIIDNYSVSGSLVVDPFLGSATTGIEALRSGRRFWRADISLPDTFSKLFCHV